MNSHKICKTPFSPPFPTVTLHPLTIKALKRGHPWVTLDKFSKNFPRDKIFLIGQDKRDGEYVLLLNDPHHKNIKARVWSLKGPFHSEIENFNKHLNSRVYNALLMRHRKEILKERNNFYLIFGEVDFLPGITVQLLGNTILIQYYATFWIDLEDRLLKALGEAFYEIFSDIRNISAYVQDRTLVSGTKIRQVKLSRFESNKNPQSTFLIHEFGLNYEVVLDRNYDCGIFSDMSFVRKSLRKFIKKDSSVLNLYSYTGAFSLMALQENAKEVVSVDLSEKHMDWLNKNISLNTNLDASKHLSIVSSALEAINTLQKEFFNFDLIISDPPSCSNDGKKRFNVLTTHQEMIPKLLPLLNDGGLLFLAINTRSTSIKKFERIIIETIEQEIKNKHIFSSFKIIERFSLGEDCPKLTNFDEGSYLKILLISFSK